MLYKIASLLIYDKFYYLKLIVIWLTFEQYWTIINLRIKSITNGMTKIRSNTQKGVKFARKTNVKIEITFKIDCHLNVISQESSQNLIRIQKISSWNQV